MVEKNKLATKEIGREYIFRGSEEFHVESHGFDPSLIKRISCFEYDSMNLNSIVPTGEYPSLSMQI